MSIETRKLFSKRNKLFVAIILFVIGISISTLHDSFAYVTTRAIYPPPDYSTFQPPANGGSYTDPVFGTAIKRISNAMTTTDAGNGGKVTTITPEYSTMSPFNQDNTRLLIQHFSYFAVYDGDGNFLKDLYQYGVHASAEPRWSRSDPNVFYFINGNQLKSFNIGTNAVSVVHTFSEYSVISGKGESDISFDGTKFVFCGDDRQVFVYDFVNNVKGSVLDVSGHPLDSLYITPDNHVTITWLATGTSRYSGIEMFDQNMNFLRQLTHAGGHMDVTRDTNGDEVLVWANFGDAQLTTPCTAGVTKIRLADAKQTCIWTGDWGEAVHVSATDNSGWAFIEVYTPKNLTLASDWTPYQNELLQVKLDGTEVRRLAHHRSRPYPGNTYVYMPKISASRDGMKVVFASNYGLQSILGYPANYSDTYLIDISQASPSTGGTSSPGSTTSGTPSDSGTTTTGGTTTGSITPPPTGITTPPTTASTTPTTAITRIEDTDPAVAYAGTWFNNTASVQSGSHARLSMDANSTATLNFNGTGVTVLGFRDEWSGIARIYLDGTLKGDVDTYATTSVAKVPMYSVSGLTPGSHTVQVMATGTKGVSSAGKWVWVDAFDIEPDSTSSITTTNTGTTTTSSAGPTATTSTGTTSSGTTSSIGTTNATTTTNSGGATSAGGTTTTSSTGTTSTGSTAPAPTGTLYRIEENNPAVHYTGMWAMHAGSVHSANSAKLANKSGARATFQFVGTSVTFLGFRDKASGIGRVYIDDVLKSEIDTYSASSVAQATIYTVSDLSWGTHTIAIEATGRRSPNSQGSWVWVDAFDYVGDALSSSLAAATTTASNDVAIPGGTSVVSADSPSLQIGSGVVDAGTIGLSPFGLAPSRLAPSGLAIFGHREDGVLVSEAGVAGVAAVLEGRIYAEVAGPVMTGLAISNPNNTAANMRFYFTDSNGSDSSTKTLQLPPHGQISRFLNQAPFDGPQSMHGTFTFNSDVPVAAIALRGITNERGEFLMTTLPVADADQWVPASMFFPHFADGAGWSTKFVLVNPTEETISGTLRFVSQGNGSNPGSLTLNVEGQNQSSVTYNIPARSSRTFSTSGDAAQMVVGSAQIMPDTSNAAPVGVAIFSLKVHGVTVAEAGIPSSSIGNAFRMYADANSDGSIETGVAITNLGPSEASVTFQLIRLDGRSTGLRGSLTVPASGQRALFLNNLAGLQSLPTPFKGILRINSDSDIAVSGLRTRINERGDFLITTTSPTDENNAGVSRIVFPQVVDGNGYSTEMILYSGSAAQPGSGDLQLYSQSGAAAGVNLKK